MAGEGELSLPELVQRVRLDATGFAAGAAQAGGAAGGFISSVTSVLKEHPVLALGAAVIGTLGHIGAEFQKSFNQIKVSTGATGKTFDGLKESMKNVLAGTAGSFSQASVAVSQLYIRTGLTGKALTDMAKQEVNLARITKSDVAGTIQQTLPLFTKYNVATRDQGHALDILFKASQKGGTTVTALASMMNRGQFALQQFGYGFSQSAALASNFSRILGTTAPRAFQSLTTAFAKIAKAGQDPHKVLEQLIKDVEGGKPKAEAMAEAFKLLGARGGSELVTAIQHGAFSIKDLTKTITDGRGGINATATDVSTLGGKFTRMKNEVLVALQPVATAVIEFANKGLGFLLNQMRKLGPVVGAAGRAVRTVFEDVFGALSTGFSKGVHADGIIGVFQSIGAAARKLVDGIRAIFAGIPALISGDASKVGAAIAGIFGLSQTSTAARTIIAILNSVRNTIAVLATNALKFGKIIFATLKPVFDTITKFLAGRPQIVLALLAPVLLLITKSLVLMVASPIISGLKALAAGFAFLFPSVAGVATSLAGIAAPILAVAAVIAILGAGVYLAYQHFKPFATAVDAIRSAFSGNIAAIIAGVTAALAGLVAVIGLVAPGLLGLSATAGAIAAGFLLPVAAVAALGAAFFLAYQHIAPFREAVDFLGRSLATAGEFVASNFIPAVQSVAGVMSQLVGPFIAFGESAVGPFRDLQAAAEHVFAFLKLATDAVLFPMVEAWRLFGSTITAVVGDALNFVLGTFRRVFDVIRTLVAPAFEFVLATIRNVLEVIKGIIDVFVGLLSFHWSRAWSGLGEIVGGAMKEVGSLLKLALQALVALVPAALHELAALFGLGWAAIVATVSNLGGELLRAIGAGLGQVKDFVVKFWPEILGAIFIGLPILAAVGPAIAAIIVPAFAAVGALAATAFEGAQALFTAAGSLVARAVAAGMEIVVGLMPAIAAAASTAWEVAQAAFQVVGGLLAQAVAAGMALAAPLFAALGTAAAAAFEAAAALAATLGIPLLIAAAVVGAGLLIYHFRSEIISGLSTAWSAITSFMADHWKEALLILATGGLAIVPLIVAKFHTQIVGGIKAAFDAVFDLARRFMPELLGFLIGGGPLGAIVAHFRSAIVGGMSTAFSAAVDEAKAFPGQLLGALSSAGSVLGQVGTALVQGLVVGVTAGLSGIATVFTQWIPNALGALLDFRLVLERLAGEMIRGFIAGLIAADVGLYKFFSELPGRILSALGSLASLLTRAGSSALAGFLAGGTAGTSAVLSFFAALPGRIAGFFAAAGSWLLGAGEAILRGLWAGIRTVWDREVAFWTTLPGRIEGYFSAAGSWLLHAGGQIVQGLTNGITSAASSVTGWIKALPGQLSSAATDAAHWLYDVGRHIVEGLKNGIIDAAVGFGSWVAEHLNPVNDVKALLGISSPSAVFADIGKEIPAGMLQGVLGGAGAVFDYFAGLPASLIGALGDIGSSLGGEGARLIGGLFDGIRTVWDREFGFFATIGPRIVGVFASLGGSLLNAGRFIITSLLNGARVELGAMLGFFHAIPGLILGYYTTVGTLLLGAGRAILSGLHAGASAAWGLVSGFFGSVPGRILGFFGGAANWLVGAGLSILNGLRNGAVRGVTGVATYLGGLGGRLVGFLGNVDNILVDAGSRILHGLVHGFGNAVDHVKNFLGDLGGKIVSWKGPPAADDVLLVDNGKRIIVGLTVGMDQAAPKVRQKAVDIASGMVNDINKHVNAGVADSDFAKTFADKFSGAFGDLTKKGVSGQDALASLGATLHENFGSMTLDTQTFSDTFNQAVTDLEQKGVNAEDAINAVARSLPKLNDPSVWITFRSSQDSVALGFNQLVADAKGATDAVDKTSGALNLNSQAGRQVQGDVTSLVSGIRQMADAQVSATGNVQAATAGLQLNAQALANQFVHMGLNQGQADRLAASYFGIPTDRATNIHNNADLAAALVDAYHVHLNSIPHAISTDLNINNAQALNSLGQVLNTLNALGQNTTALSLRLAAGGRAVYGAVGGIFEGPTTGYPAVMHGREAILPLNDPSRALEILMKSGLIKAFDSLGGTVSPLTGGPTVANDVAASLDRSLSRLVAVIGTTQTAAAPVTQQTTHQYNLTLNPQQATLDEAGVQAMFRQMELLAHTRESPG